MTINPTYLKGNVTIGGDLTVNDTFTFGDAVTDTLVLKGRLATSTAAGAALAIGATYAYGEGVELRYQITDWTLVGSSFKGMYLRSEAATNTASGKSVYGQEIYGVLNNVTMGTTGNLWGGLFYAYVKGVSAVGLNHMYAVQAELTWDAGRTGDCTITTRAACVRAKITGGRVDDYTKIHGYVLTIGEMDGDSQAFGNGILLEDDADMSGTNTLTTGLNIAIGCADGILIAGACSDNAIEITGSCTDSAIQTATGTFATGILLGGTMTTGISIGTAATGLTFTGGYTTTAIQLGTSGSKMTLAANDDHVIDINVTSAATGGSVRPIHMIHTMTGATAVGGRAEFEVAPSIVAGGWVNAVKAYLNFGASGGVSGLASAMNAELKMPSSLSGSSGTYACYEGNIVYPASGFTGGQPTSWFRLRTEGTDKTYFDDNGYLFDLQGVSEAAGKFILIDGDEPGTWNEKTVYIKCRYASTEFYLLGCVDQTVD
jgi:hypothetical protein